MTLPNILTLCRILLTVPFAVFLLIPSRGFRFAALAVFILAAATDYADGKIARKTGSVSVMGKFLDPLADKIFMSAAFIILLRIPGLDIPVWTVIVIIGREFAVNGIRMVAASEGLVIPAAAAGKVKTGFQMFTAALIIFFTAVQWGYSAAGPLAAAAAVISAATGLFYVKDNMELLKNTVKQEEI